MSDPGSLLAPAPSATDPVDGTTSPWRSVLDSRGLEVGLSVALVAIATVHLVAFLRAMATTPLWNDEIWSVLNFSSQGPGTSATTINNAIPLNVINSILPGSDSLDPLRVRLVSMVAIVAMQALVLVEFTRRRWYLPGALLFAAFAINFNWLDTVLQARGYGILGLCATVLGVATWRYLEDGRRRWLVALVAASVLGAWTVPSFAFLVGPLWLLLLATRRNRHVLLAIVVMTVGVLAVYGVLLDDLWRQSTTYSDTFGHQYAGPDAAYRTVRNFLFEREAVSPLAIVWMLAFVAPLLVALPGGDRGPALLRRAAATLTGPVARTQREAVRVLLAATAGVMVIALILTTPPQRTVAYLVVPLALATAIALAVLREAPRHADVWRSFVVVAAALGCIHGAFAVRDLSVTPIENWSGAADYVETTFPDGTEVHAITRSDYLDRYLDGGRHALRTDLVIDEVRAGRLVVAAYDPNGEVGDIRASVVSGVDDLVEMDIPQRRGTPAGAFPLLFAPPPDPHVARVAVDGRDAPEVTDRRLATGVDLGGPQPTGTAVIDAELAPGTVGRSVVVAVSPGLDRSAITATRTGPDGTTTTVPDDALLTSAGLITVHLDDQPTASVRLSIALDAWPGASGDARQVRELWAYTP